MIQIATSLPARLRAAWRGIHLRHAAAGVCAVLAAVLAALPTAPQQNDVGPLERVEPPLRDDPAHPAAAFEKRPVLLSLFVDLGHSATLTPLAVEGTSWDRVFVRSAHRTRAFLIVHPPPGPLCWSSLASGSRPVRRYVQFAMSAQDAQGQVRLRFAARAASWRSLWPLLIGGLLLLWPRVVKTMKRLLPVLRSRAAPIAATLVAALIALLTMAGPLPYTAHGDEIFTIGMGEGILATGDYRIPLFKYPRVHGYFQAAGPIAYGIARAASGGLAYHDPYTNRLYYDGRPLGEERLFAPDFALRMAKETLPTIRRAYACAFAVLVLLAYALGACARSPRAGLAAALAVAVQPVLRDAAMLPNMSGALLALAAGFLFLRLPPTTGSAFVKGLMAGILMAWKFNPTFGILLLALVLIESPAGSRVSRALLALAATPLGFWLAFPDLPWQLDRFAADLAREAFHYSSTPHGVFSTDEPLASAVYEVYLRPDYGGNYVVALLALVGTAAVAWRGSWRHRWILLWPILGGSAFMLHQFLQFGRNYAIPVAYVCVVAGIGADLLLTSIGRRWRRIGMIVSSALLILAPLQVLGRALQEERTLGPTARSQALAWIDRYAALGDRIILVESSFDELEGRQPDQARFQVRRRDSVPEDRPGKEADFLVVNESQGASLPETAVLRARFTGSAVWGSGQVYAVYEITAP